MAKQSPKGIILESVAPRAFKMPWGHPFPMEGSYSEMQLRQNMLVDDV
jgi:hypothetical protein